MTNYTGALWMTGLPNTFSGTLVVGEDAVGRNQLVNRLKSLNVDLGPYFCGVTDEGSSIIRSSASLIKMIFCGIQMDELSCMDFMRQLAKMHYQGDIIFYGSGCNEFRTMRTILQLAKLQGLNVLGAIQRPVTDSRLYELLNNRSKANALVACSYKHFSAAQLRDAIKVGEFINHYQPKVDMGSGAIVGVEALVRWIHPLHGMVMPDEFIAEAESSGLLDEITKIVLENSLRQLRIWRSEGHIFDMSVNVSARTLCAPDFPDLIEKLAAEAGIPLASLVLEVTEGQLIGNPLLHLDTLIRLRLKRVRLSLDDFGTGYSSLARLRDLPFDELKIDRSFVHHVARDSSLQAILEAILRLARELGMRAVGEGVSSLEDWRFLRSSGCDVAQGYFVAKPMSGAGLESWAAQWKLEHKCLA